MTEVCRLPNAVIGRFLAPFQMLCLMLCLTIGLLIAGGPVAAQSDTTAVPDDPQSLYAEALRYHDGDGVARNYATAADLFARAAAQGHAGAQNYLGRYYHVGYGVPKDQAQALRWLAAAAQGGNPQFLYDYGVALENGADGSSAPDQAAQAYAHAAEAGHIPAKVSLGVLFQNGKGVPQDYARALALYSDAAEAGNARALNNLGLLYVRGHGVPQDHARAAEYFAQAAEKGLKQAYTNLGVMYENGFGAPLDEARAAELYRLGGQGRQVATADQAGDSPLQIPYDARLVPLPDDIASNDAARKHLVAQANGGDPVARFQLAWLLTRDPDAPLATLRQAASLFQAAAQDGYGPAMVGLGLLHFQGRGVLQDYVHGYAWLTLAETAGQSDATTLAIKFAAPMTADQINQAQAIVASIRGQTGISQ